ncbi:MAG: ABC transporter permease [Geminicoccaceae bacterium]
MMRDGQTVPLARATGWFAGQHWSFVLGMIASMIVVSMLVLAPWITSHAPTSQDLLMRLEGPSAEHWIGTDHLGRDLWSRLLYGGQFSVTIAAITLLLSVAIGTLIGTYCGRVGGVVDEVAMRVVDVLLSFPEVIVALFLIAIIGPGYGTLVLSLTLVGWTPFARLSRGLALELSAKEFIAAAEILGCSRWFILLRHVVPNALRPITAMAFLRFGHKLITVGGLSYLGLGVQAPFSDWGAMLADARPYAERLPMLVFAPGVAIMLTALSVTMVGQGLEIGRDRKRLMRM